MKKRNITLLTAFAAAAAFASTAQTSELTVDNFSFEDPNLSVANPAWPTSGAAPTDWTRVVGGNDFSGLEARVGKAGPTDGDQIMFLDDRSTWSANGSVLLTSNSIGTGAELKALGGLLEITFDARKGFLDGEKDGDAPTVTFDAYVSIGGLRDTSDDMTTNLGAASLLRTGTVIQNDTGLNMDTFTITVPTSGMGDADDVQINFGYSWGTAGDGTRTSIDNVTASVGRAATLTITEIDYDPDAESGPTVTLSWNAQASATYTVYYSRDPGNLQEGEMGDGDVDDSYEDNDAGGVDLDPEEGKITIEFDNPDPDARDLFFSVHKNN